MPIHSYFLIRALYEWLYCILCKTLLSGFATDISDSKCLFFEFSLWLSSLKTWHNVHEDVVSIPGLTQWFKDPEFAFYGCTITIENYHYFWGLSLILYIYIYVYVVFRCRTIKFVLFLLSNSITICFLFMIDSPKLVNFIFVFSYIPWM